MNLAITSSIILIACTVSLPQTSFARTGSLVLGLSTGYDYQERTYEEWASSEGDEVQPISERKEKTEALGITPSIVIVSEGKDDRFELRLAPSIKYDLEESDTDWDADIILAAEKNVTKNWLLRARNAFIRSDYANELIVADPSQPFATEQLDGPALSGESGREQYWRNTASIDSSHSYGEDRSAGIGFDYTVLRNESSASSRDEYDRYALRLNNGHRYNSFWKSTAGLSVVQGDFEEQEPQEAFGELVPAPSDDVWEYRVNLGLENDSFRLNRLLLNYSYVAARYDDDNRFDNDIHQTQLSWRREISRQWSSGLGAGFSYAENGDSDEWGGNGLIDISYQNRYTTTGFLLTKGYDVDNFSGNNESGIVDFWDARLRASHQVLESLSIDGQLSYRNNKRSFPIQLATEDPAVFDSMRDSYTEELYAAGLGLTYSFLRYYSARLGYTYSEQDSDRPGEDYDDHRILVTLSWEQEWLRW